MSIVMTIAHSHNASFEWMTHSLRTRDGAMRSAPLRFCEAYNELGEKKRDHAKWRIYPRRLIGQIGKAN
jgi:hypothetical protein